MGDTNVVPPRPASSAKSPSARTPVVATVPGGSTPSSSKGSGGKEVSGEGETKKPKKVSQVGDFRIEKKLGQGGMGTVFLATQVSLDRKVALKTLSPEFAKKAGLRQAVFARSPLDGPAPASQRGAGLRRRHGQRRQLRRHRIHRRPQHAGLDERPQAAQRGGRPACHPGLCRCAQARARPKHDPPRHQAGQHPGDEQRASSKWPISGSPRPSTKTCR